MKSTFTQYLSKTAVGITAASIATYLFMTIGLPIIKSITQEAISPDLFATVGQMFIGFIFGFLYPSKWHVISLSSVFLLLLLALYEIMLEPDSHNLWHIELFGYFALALLALIGAFFGKQLRNLKN